jgi:hypothetical protein
MNAARHPQNWWPYWTCWWDSSNSFALWLIWISFLIGYPIYPWLIFIKFFQPMRLRHIWSVLWIIHQLTSWSIVVSDWCTGSRRQQLVWLGKCLEYCSRVISTLQTMYGFSFFSTSRYFFFGELVFLSWKVYIFTCVINVFVHLTLLKKLTWNCTSSNIIVDAAFFSWNWDFLSKAPNLDIEIDQDEL